MSYRIVGIGEVLWDLLPAGPQPGGAPANFAYHAHALGAQASVVPRVGNGDLGRDIRGRLKQFGFSQATVQVDGESPTGTVCVSVNEDGIPHYIIHEDVAWDRLEVSPAALAVASEAETICFGSLAQRSATARAAIQRLVGCRTR